MGISFGALVPAAALLRRGGALAALALVLSPMAAMAQSDSATIVRVQELEAEIRRLNGKIEALDHRMSRIVDDASLRIGDLEYRVIVLEGGDPSLLGAAPPLGGTAEPSVAPTAAPVVAVSERVAFEVGVTAIQDGKLLQGRAALDAFRRDYPGSPLSGDAQHWIAEALFAAGDYGRAAQTYLANMSQYPDGRQAPDSVIGLALALEKLGQPSEACATLDEVPRRYPADGPAADRAVAERARLDCR
ncbi:MAG: tol-pal system protein YbgF [Paracoccaceae bacterium]|jgi:tol-pal system protein YbgF